MIQATERIDTIAKRCREHYNPFPETLINAMCQYLAGQGPLPQVQQEWKAARNITAYYYSNRFIILSDASSECLDELDLRILDICVAVSLVVPFLQIIAEQGPIEQAYTYLLSQGVDKRRILKELIEAGNYISNSEQVIALGRYLLSLLAEHSGDILNILAQGPWVHNSLPFIQLLLAARPAGYLDLAEQVAKAAQLQAITSYLIGDYAALLVKHDYARFHEWARQIAGSTSPGDEHARSVALHALLECNIDANIDLAIEAAHTPLGRYHWVHATLQCMGIQAAFQLDPVKYLPLVEEAAVSPNPSLGKCAVQLLKEADFEQARPILQRCIARGEIEAALKALAVLLQHEWPERQAYMLSLLSHRSKQMRDTLIKWLIQEALLKGEEYMVEALAPSLAHPNADARLAAVQALQRIGGEQARALLAARLDVEKSLKVKQAILDAVGVAAVAASDEAAPA